MVNEERLHYMIKMAEFDTNDRKASRPMMQYARRDYVSLQLLKSFIVGTIALVYCLHCGHCIPWIVY